MRRLIASLAAVDTIVCVVCRAVLGRAGQKLGTGGGGAADGGAVSDAVKPHFRGCISGV